MASIIEHYQAEHVPNPNPRGETSYETFYKVRHALLKVCREHGITGPDDSGDADFFLADDQYSDELYHYIQVYNRKALTTRWLQEMMSALLRFPGWGVGISNIRFAYMLIFANKLMVNGHLFAGCLDVDSVALAASSNLWGVKGEATPYTDQSYHRDELLASPICGCFHCCQLYDPVSIVDWTDEDSEGNGQTAVCPKCGKGHVIAPRATFTLNLETLRQLHLLAFGP